MRKIFTLLFFSVLGLFSFTPFLAKAQSLDTLNYWLRVNRGFAKCAPLNSYAGEAEWFTDDFDIDRLINRRGEMYAYIAYGSNGSNTAYCAGGMFRHDLITNRWIKVANHLGGYQWMVTNNTDIFICSNNKLYRLTDDYVNNPTGWQQLAYFKGTELPGYECRGSSYVGIPGTILDAIGDTIYLVQEAPCNNPTQIMKLYVGGDFIVNPATDVFRQIMGDHPGMGILQSQLRTSVSQHYTSYITEPIGGLFKYFMSFKYQGSGNEVPDFLWTYDPRIMPSAQYPGMMPFATSRAEMNGNLFYSADDGVNGFELWSSNGTSGGTAMIKDITPGNRESAGGHKRFPKNFGNIGGTMFFSAYDNDGYELWKTDGTAAGTMQVKDIYAGTSNGQAFSSEPGEKIEVDGVLLFAATTANGRELWKSDGTAAGTVQVADINAGTGSSNPANFTKIGTTLFFTATTASGGTELYKSESPFTSATLVRDIATGSASASPQYLTAINSTLFFAANDGTNGNELWKSDAPYNASSTVLVRNIWPGIGNSNPRNLYNFKNELYFAASDSVNGTELWKSTGAFNAASTTLLRNIHTTALEGSFPNLFTPIGDTLFFRAKSSLGFELWKTGGTTTSTRLVADINPSGNSSPQYLTVLNGMLYFTADDGTNGRELYRCGPAPYTSVSRIDIRTGSAGSTPVCLTKVGNAILFTADDGTNGPELWKVEGSTPTLLRNISKNKSPYGWRNISQGPDYNNLTGTSNPVKTSDPGYDPNDPDTWVPLRIPNKPLGGWAGIDGVVTSFDKKQIYFTTQTGAYRWVGSGHEYVNGTRENGLAIFPTNNGIAQRTRSGLRMVVGAVTSTLGNSNFFPSCVHTSINNVVTPDDGLTWYATKIDMKDPNICDWGNGQAAQMGIWRIRTNPELVGSTGTTRNIHIGSGGYFGGTGNDDPIGVAYGGRVPGGKAHIFVAGNFPVHDAALKARKPATDITINNNGYVTTSSAQAQVLRYNNNSDTLYSITYLGTNATDLVTDMEAMDRPTPGIGRRMVVAGTFGVVCLDSLGRVLWRIASADLPGNTSNDISVDIDNNGHVAILRANADYDHKFRIYDENGSPVTGITTCFRQFANDIAIKNDTVVICGFRNGCLPSTLPRCFGAGGNTGSCSGAEVQTCFIYYYKKGPSVSSAMELYGKTYDYPDGAQGRDVADTRVYHVNFGHDGKLYFLGESAGSESIYRWGGFENQTVELNSVVQGVCDGTNTNENGTISYNGLKGVSKYSDLSNTASAHIAFFGRANYQKVLSGGYCAVERGEWIFPRTNDGKSNSFRIRKGEGYIQADKDGQIYVLGSAAYKFAGRDVQKVNGQAIGNYSGDMTIHITGPNFSGTRFWGTFCKPTGDNGSGGTGPGRMVAIRDSLVAFVGKLNLNEMFSFNPTQSLTPWNSTNSAIGDGYLALFHSNLAAFANKDTIKETVVKSDTIIDPALLAIKCNFSTTNTSACVAPSGNNQVAFSSTNTLLPADKYPGWTWYVRWDFGIGGQAVAGNATFNGTLNQGLTGYVNPTASWSSPGLKTVTMRLVGKHPTKDSVSVEEKKFNYINILPSNISLTGITGPTLGCNGGVYEYEAQVDLQTSWAINSYNWTVPTGATILVGQGSKKIKVRMGQTSGNVSVVALTQCGNTPIINRAITVSNPLFEALMICKSMSLTTGEQYIANDLQSRGYNVVIKEHQDFDTLDKFCRNIIIISSTVDSAFIGNKFTNINIPVVVMKNNVLPRMNMTGSVLGTDYGTTANQLLVNINFNGNHDIKGTLSNGSTIVFGSTAAKNVSWGNPNSNAIRIAEVNNDAGKATLFGFEAGAIMSNNYAAPARRVAFFTNDRAGLDSLNNEGKYLLSRALCWATNNCNSPLITTLPLYRSSFAPYDTIGVRFTTTGTFNPGNQFIVQFSDRWGDFNSPTNANTLTLAGTNVSGAIAVDPIPSSLRPGINYGIRVISTNPPSYGTARTGITLLDSVSGPPKIIYLCDKSPTQTLNPFDTALVRHIRENYDLPLEYMQISDITNLKLAGAKMIIISTTASGAGNNAQWGILRYTPIPIISLSASRLLHDVANNNNGLGIASANNSSGCTSNQNPIMRNMVVTKDTLMTQGYDGWTPFHDPAEPYGRTFNCISSAALGPGAVVLARTGFSATDNVVFFFHEKGSMMANGPAPGRRAFFPLYLTNNRYLSMSNDGKLMLQKTILWCLSRTLPVITRITAAGKSASLCAGSTIDINVATTGGEFKADNQFIAELSSPDGNFNAPGFPLQIGEAGGSIIKTLTATIPVALPSGAGYKIRVRSTNPAMTSKPLQDTTTYVEVDDRHMSKRVSNATTISIAQLGEAENLSSGSNYFQTLDNYQAEVGWSYLSVTGSSNSFFLRYVPTLPVAGAYEVFVLWPSLQGGRSAAQFIINHSAGSTTVTRDQTVNGGRWISLGSYNFLAGTAGNLEVKGDQTNLRMDAVRFVRNPNHPNPAPTHGARTFSIGDVWTGAFNNNWHDARNWSLCTPTASGIPDAGTSVVIPAYLCTTCAKPVISQEDATCRSLFITNGDANLTIRNGRRLNVELTLTNNDTLNVNGNSTLKGTGTNLGTIVNNGWLLADTCLTISGNLTNAGVFSVKNYLTGGTVAITSVNNTSTGIFTTPNNRTTSIANGFINNNRMTFGSLSTFNGDINHAGGSLTYPPNIVINGNLAINGGSLSWAPLSSGDAFTINGNMFIGPNGALNITNNMSFRIFISGTLTNNGTLNHTQSCFNPRCMNDFNAFIVNNAVMNIQPSSGGRPTGFVHRGINNNGLINCSSNGAHIYLNGGTIVNNGSLIATSSSANNFYADDIINSGSLQINKRGIVIRNLTNQSSGLVELSKDTTVARTLNIWNLENYGTFRIAEHTKTTNATLAMSINNIQNYATGVIEIGRTVSGSFASRSLSLNQSFNNVGRVSLNGTAINLNSKAARQQMLTGLDTLSGNVTVDNEFNIPTQEVDLEPDNMILNLYGQWGTTNSGTRMNNAGYRFLSPITPGTAADSIVVRPNLITEGNYQVQVFYAINTDRCTNVRHRVFYNGTFADVNVNQTINNGTWVTLGTYYFRADGNERLVIGGTAHTTCTFAADGVRFVYVNGAPTRTANGAYLGSPTVFRNNTTTLTKGKLYLGSSNLTLSGTASIAGVTESNYIVTNNSATGGRLIQTVGTSAITFPIGVDSNYTPVVISNGGNKPYGVSVLSGVRTGVSTGSFTCSNAVNRTWIVEPTTATSGVTLRFRWSNGITALVGKQELTNFVRSSAGVYSGSTSWGLLGAATVSGTDPYFAEISNVSVNPTDKFHVASSTLASCDKFWVGGGSPNPTSWFQANNWSPEGVPNDVSSITIPAAANNPVISSGTAQCYDLTLTTGNLTISGGELQLSGSFYRNPTSTFTHSGGLVSMAGVGSTAITGTNTFNRLNIRNSAGVQLPNKTTTVTSDLTIAAGGTLRISTDSTLAALNVRGNFDNSFGGSFVQQAGTVSLDGTTAQTIRGATTFRNLTINNGAGITTDKSDTITGALTFVMGNINIGNNDLILKDNATISGAGSNGYVVTPNALTGGTVVRTVGASDVLFPVGTNSYTPVTVSNGLNKTHRVRVFNGVMENAVSGTVFTEKAVNKTWVIQPDFSKDNIVQDNSDASGILRTVSLSTSTPGVSSYSGIPWGANAWCHSSNSTDTITFVPTFATSGQYEVFIYYPAQCSGNSCSAIRYDVRHANGTTAVTLNQNQNRSRWVSLGTYTFNSGYNVPRGSVRINAGCGGSRTMIDAVKYEFKGPSTGSTVKLQWNSSDAMPNFNALKSKMAANTGTGNAWEFMTATAYSGSSTVTATSTVNQYPYFTVGGWGTNYWTGSTDSTWSSLDNWSMFVPDATDDVIIPANIVSKRGPKISSGTATCRNLTIMGGSNGNMRISGGLLNVYGNLDNSAEGSIIHVGGKVVMHGNSPATISGTNSFQRLEIRNTAGVTLPANTTVRDSLVLSSGGKLIQNNGFLTVNGHMRFAGTSEFTMNDGVLYLKGNFDNTAGGNFRTFTTGGTVELNGSVAQNILGKNTFRNLTISNVLGVNLPSDSIIINRDLIVNANAKLNMGNGNLILRNNFVNNGQFNQTNGTITFSGTGSQLLTGTNTFNNLRINKASGTVVLPARTTTVNGNLTLSSGTTSIGTGATLFVRQQMSLASAATLSMTDGTLNLRGDLDNTAAANLDLNGGTVSLSGKAKAQIKGYVAFFNLEINKDSIGQDTVKTGLIRIKNSLQLTKGLLRNTSQNDILVDESATLSTETDTKRVIGRILQKRTVAGSPVNFQGLGIQIDPGNENLGSVSVKRISGLVEKDASFVTGPQIASKGIDCIWQIDPDQQPQNPVSLNLSWLASLDNGNNINLPMNVYKIEAPYEGAWTRLPQYYTAVNRTLTISTSSFSKWTASDENNPLPVTLVSFSGKLDKKKMVVNLDWITASEHNNDYFTIERSTDAQYFAPIGRIKGGGTRVSMTKYAFTDEYPLNGLMYYRLRQTDYDGRYEYSNIVPVKVNISDKAADMILQPNPTSGQVSIEASALKGSGQAAIEITDIAGRVLVKQVTNISLGNVTETLNLSDLPCAVYIVRIQTNQENLTQKLVINR